LDLKSNPINRKDRKDFEQRSQRIENYSFLFAHFGFLNIIFTLNIGFGHFAVKNILLKV